MDTKDFPDFRAPMSKDEFRKAEREFWRQIYARKEAAELEAWRRKNLPNPADEGTK